jgi:hypothetical protein
LDGGTPKLGARASRRYTDLELRLGEVQAEEIRARAVDRAHSRGDTLTRLEDLFVAEGMAMPARAKTHYRRRDLVPDSFGC